MIYVYDWNPTAIEALKAGWAEGLSGRQIASTLPRDAYGRSPSRNAVIGKIHRLGLSGRTKVVRPKAPRAPSRRKNPFRFGNFIPVGKPEPLPIPKADDKARVSLLQLTHLTCKWPVGHVGQEGFGFCGDLITEGFSYCPGHCARAFTTERQRRGRVRQSTVTGGFA